MRHKYYCDACSLYVFADDPTALAERLNYHNHLQHPHLSNKWDGELIVKSRHYETADKAPAYVAPSPVGPKTLTSDDRKWLAELLVKW